MCTLHPIPPLHTLYRVWCKAGCRVWYVGYTPYAVWAYASIWYCIALCEEGEGCTAYRMHQCIEAMDTPYLRYHVLVHTPYRVYSAIRYYMYSIPVCPPYRAYTPYGLTSPDPCRRREWTDSRYQWIPPIATPSTSWCASRYGCILWDTNIPLYGG